VLDLIFIAVIGLSVIYSFTRGAIREFFGLLALVGGAFIGLKATGTGVEALTPNIASAPVAAMVAFLIAFVVTSLLLLLIGSLLAHAAQSLHLGWADRLVGAFFGFAKGVLLVTVLVMLLAAFQSPEKSAVRGSSVAARVTELARWACGWLPPQAGEMLRRRLGEPAPQEPLEAAAHARGASAAGQAPGWAATADAPRDGGAPRRADTAHAPGGSRSDV